MPGVLAALRPEPHRGDQVAAGVVVLAVAIYVLEIRFADTWGAGIHFVIDGLATFAVGALAVQSPLEGERPRAFQSVLYIATFFLAILTLANLADILGADDPLNASGTLVWIGRNGPRASEGASGLGSKVSRCAGPPTMLMKMQLFALPRASGGCTLALAVPVRASPAAPSTRRTTACRPTTSSSTS